MIRTIIKKINHLTESYSPLANINTLQFHDSLISAYIQKKILGKLHSIILNNPDKDYVEALQAFLQDNWNFVKASCLAYTAMPDHAVTTLLCDIAEYVGDEKNIPAIQVLMPNIACDSLFLDRYPNLDDADLNTILKTHILADTQDYLIPASILLDEKIKNDFSLSEVPNVYFDTEQHSPTSTMLLKTEIGRLAKHSNETTAIVELSDQMYFLIQNDSSLLSELHRLIPVLTFNSVKGVGKEGVAGEHGYAAIAKFMQYWDLLDPNNKDIPEDVKSEINLLKTFSSNPEEIKKTPLETCLATRRDKLVKAISGHEEELACIRPNADERNNQIKNTLDNLKKAKKHLQDLLDKDSYSGQDSLGINAKIIQELQIDLNVVLKHFGTFVDTIKGIRAEEISELCKIPKFVKKMLKAIDNVENLALLFAVHVTDEVLKILLESMRSEPTMIVRSVKDFIALLIPLNIKQCKVVCETLAANLHRLIKNSKDLEQILESLTPEQRTIVLEALKDKLPQLINNLKDLNQLFKYLTPEQRTIALEALKNKLSTFIKDWHHLNEIFKLLTPAQRTIPLEALKNKLSTIIKDSHHLNEIFKLLTPEQRTIALEALENKLSTFIKASHHFNDICKLLTPAQRAIVFKAVKNQIPNFITNSYSFNSIFKLLTPAQRAIIFEAVKDKLPTLINNHKDLNRIFEDLTPKQRAIVFEAVKNEPSKILGLISDLHSYLYNLPAPTVKTVHTLTAKKEPLKPMENNNVLDEALQYLTSKQRIVFLEIVKKQLPVLIKSQDVLQRALKYVEVKRSSLLSETPNQSLSTLTAIGMFRSEHEEKNQIQAKSESFNPSEEHHAKTSLKGR